MTTAFTILLAGHLTVTERLRRQIAGTRVIAADAGIAHADALGLDVDTWVGDFDSCDDALAEQHAHVPRQTHPAAKDATDGELAIAEAIRQGARSLVLAGGFGGQSDHALQHFMQAVELAQRGLKAFISSGHEEAWPLITGEHLIDMPAGSRFSIVAFNDLRDLTLVGVEWPLSNRYVPFGSSLTLSNVAKGPVTVQLADGHGVLIAYPE